MKARAFFWLLPGGVAAGLTAALVDSGMKSGILLLLAYMAAVALRKSAAATRHVVWTAAMACALAMPLLSLCLPQWRVLPSWMGPEPVARDMGSLTSLLPPLPASSEVLVEHTSEASETLTARSDLAPTASDAQTPALAPTPMQPIRPDFSSSAAVLLGWAIGAGLLLLPLLRSAWSLHRLSRRSEIVTEGVLAETVKSVARELRLRRDVTIHIGSADAMPMVWGVWRARLLLPSSAGQWLPARLRAVMLHELAHVNRRDPLALLLAQFTRAIHWFNPLAWLAVHRLRVEQEQACDDCVLRAGVKPSDYAADVLEIATVLSAAPATGAMALAMARPARLECRLRTIMHAASNRAALTRWIVIAATLAAIAIALPLAMVRAADEKPPSGEASDRSQPPAIRREIEEMERRTAAQPGASEKHTRETRAAIAEEEAAVERAAALRKEGRISEAEFSIYRERLSLLRAQASGDARETARAAWRYAEAEFVRAADWREAGSITEAELAAAKEAVAARRRDLELIENNPPAATPNSSEARRLEGTPPSSDANLVFDQRLFEREMRADQTGYLDLETGQFVALHPPGDLAFSPGESDLNARAGLNMGAAAVDAERWQASPEEIFREAAKTTPQKQVRIGGSGRDAKRTWIFKTSEGSAGILQILPHEKRPGSVLVRSKLVRPRREFEPVAVTILPSAGELRFWSLDDGQLYKDRPADRPVAYLERDAEKGWFLIVEGIHNYPAPQEKGVVLGESTAAEEVAEPAGLGAVPFERKGFYRLDQTQLPIPVVIPQWGLLRVAGVDFQNPDQPAAIIHHRKVGPLLRQPVQARAEPELRERTVNRVIAPPSAPLGAARTVVDEWLAHIAADRTEQMWALTTREQGGLSGEVSAAWAFKAIRAKYVLGNDTAAMVVSTRYKDNAGRSRALLCTLVKREGGWLIREHLHGTPEDLALRVAGFAAYPGVRYDVRAEDLIGQWRTVFFGGGSALHTFHADGTATTQEFRRGQGGEITSFRWDLQGDAFRRHYGDKTYTGTIVRLDDEQFAVRSGDGQVGYERATENAAPPPGVNATPAGETGTATRQK